MSHPIRARFGVKEEFKKSKREKKNKRGKELVAYASFCNIKHVEVANIKHATVANTVSPKEMN